MAGTEHTNDDAVLNDDDKKTLLDIARSAIEAAVAALQAGTLQSGESACEHDA